VAGTIRLVDDGAGTSTDACEALPLPLPIGTIALVDRGTCTFTVKVRNVQAAGAVAAIVANNNAGSDFFAMAGTDRKVKIPSMMIGAIDGATLRAAGTPNATVRLRTPAPPMIDGDLDSDIVFHEYGHGLTWRMIGSMSGPLAGAIGEGASDGVAMLINGDDRIGEYAYSNPNGIRRYPYVGYPLTYGDVTGLEVHEDGEVIGAIVWRLHELFGAAGLDDAALLDTYVDGMNYTPATPAFEHMRDGMLASIAARSVSTQRCLVWSAFAQFGVGVGASGVVSGSTVTVTQSFTKPVDCQ
jgi:hypothetical protein